MAGAIPLHTLAPEERATDPVLAALIARLPAGGAVWPAKKRAAWMQLMWGAFELVYETEAGEALELPSFLAKPVAGPATPAADVPAAPPKRAAPYAFMIDHDGYARRGDGTRLMPHEIGGVMYDQRGESGDFAGIVWSDDSRGIPHGLQLDIAPAF